MTAAVGLSLTGGPSTDSLDLQPSMRTALHSKPFSYQNCKPASVKQLRKPTIPVSVRRTAVRRTVITSAFEPDMSPLPVVYGTKGKVDILVDPSIYPTRFANLDQRGAVTSALM